MKKRGIITVILLILSLLLVGCGELNIDIQTTIKPSGDAIMELKLEGTGMMSELVAGGEFTGSIDGDDR